MGLTYAISVVNWIFRIFLFENIFCFSSLMLDFRCEHFKKVSETLNKWNCSQTTHSVDFCLFCLLWEKMKTDVFNFLKTKARIKLFVHS